MKTYTDLSIQEMTSVSGGSVPAWGLLGMICGAIAWLCDDYQTVPYGYCEP